MEKHYIIVNTDRIESGNQRAYLIRGGGMVTDLFWWSYRPQALIFTIQDLKDEPIINFLNNINYEIIEVNDSDLPEYKNFY